MFWRRKCFKEARTKTLLSSHCTYDVVLNILNNFLRKHLLQTVHFGIHIGSFKTYNFNSPVRENIYLLKVILYLTNKNNSIGLTEDKILCFPEGEKTHLRIPALQGI